MANANRPNILFIMTDQHHADCLGYVGKRAVQTPNLDALAGRSTWFNSMYTVSAYCAPSRTSTFTGTHLRTHRLFSNRGNLQQWFPNIVSELKQADYWTGFVGKSHVPHEIDKDVDHLRTADDWKQDKQAAGVEEDYGDAFRERFTSATSTVPRELHDTVWGGNEAIKFLDQAANKDNPWFLWYSYEPPHPPHTPLAEYEKLYDPADIEVDWDAMDRFDATRHGRRAMIEEFWTARPDRRNPIHFQQALCRYYALITMVDEQIGRVLDHLDSLGMADNTIIIFTSDHGDFAGNFGQIGKNVPGYEDLLRVPFIWHDPQRNDHGRVVTTMHQSIDLFPSLMERLDLPVPPTVQGESFLGSLDGHPASGRDVVFAETSTLKTIRTREWKLNYFVTDPSKSALYRMGAKPDETTNLWHDERYATIRQDLLMQLLQWMACCEQPISMTPLSEVYPDTRWYNWLSQQKPCCIPGEHTTSRV